MKEVSSEIKMCESCDNIHEIKTFEDTAIEIYNNNVVLYKGLSQFCLITGERYETEENYNYNNQSLEDSYRKSLS